MRKCHIAINFLVMLIETDTCFPINDSVETIVHDIIGRTLGDCNSFFGESIRTLLVNLKKLQTDAPRINSKRKKRESIRDVLAKLH